MANMLSVETMRTRLDANGTSFQEVRYLPCSLCVNAFHFHKTFLINAAVGTYIKMQQLVPNS